MTIFRFVLTNVFLWPCLALYVSIYYEANADLSGEQRIPFFGFFSGYRILSAHKQKFPRSWKRISLIVCWAAMMVTILIPLISSFIAAFRA